MHLGDCGIHRPKVDAIVRDALTVYKLPHYMPGIVDTAQSVPTLLGG